jgi:undecaprenyl diphosphate synthase
LGVSYLTLYAFSTENWNRPSLEVRALMQLLVQAIQKETATLQKNNIRLNAIGDLNQLPSSTRKSLEKAIAETAGNSRMTLTLALSYSSRWEITEAVKSILTEYKNNPFPIDSVNDQFISQFLETASMPDPDLLIRTSGEFRISNFLLWQLAYSELYFSSKLWPEFGEEDLLEAILDYQKRERRFGKTSEQLKP